MRIYHLSENELNLPLHTIFMISAFCARLPFVFAHFDIFYVEKLLIRREFATLFGVLRFLFWHS